jgi:hypothetical protein
MTVRSLILPIATLAVGISVSASVAEPTAQTASAPAPATFAGPDGWSRVEVPSPSATRTIVQWHIAGDTSTSVTYIKDATGVYEDTIALIEKNFSDNGIKPGTNKDTTCAGSRAHVVEFTAGPDGSKTIINRVVIAGSPGITTITYTRADGNAFDAEVKKAETSFCGV